MKKFLNKISQFLSLPIFILLISFYSHYKYPLMSDYDYDSGLRLKYQLLEKNKDQKKIILIGGSNLSMGINSSQIKSSFLDYQIINLGHRFQYGLNFYINLIKPFLNKNDIVLIVPEYQLILDDYFGNQNLAKVRLEKLNYSNFKIDLSPRDVLSYINQRIRFLNKLKNGSFPDKENHNRIDAFNEFGDCNAHWFWNSKKHLQYRDPSTIKIIESQYFKEFITNYRKKGIQFVLIPPMYEKNSFELSKKLIDENIKFYKKSKLDYAYPIDKMVLDSNYFYDSPYHLLHEGIKIKTNKIISILRNELKTRTHNNVYKK